MLLIRVNGKRQYKGQAPIDSMSLQIEDDRITLLSTGESYRSEIFKEYTPEIIKVRIN